MRKTLERRLRSLRWRFHPDVAGKVLSPQSLNSAAEFFDLDVKDAGHRDLLLFILAEATFGKDKVGRPKGRHGNSGGWDVWKLQRLGQLSYTYRKKGLRGDTKIANAIHADYKKEFASSAEAIRRWLPYARWTHDELLEKHRDDDPPEGWEPPEPDYDDYDD